MARKGRFGRLPRRAPDLTGAIVAMMREYWNTQENIMVSAWKEGGEVDGKPVTDERLLQFWLDRRDSVQQDDPLWDYYDQQHDQYKFAISESKVGLAYAQHKMSAREVAKWYKDQAGQFAQNSEMWRTVMGQSAKFLDAAKAASRASNSEARRKAFDRMREQNIKDYSWPVQTAMGGLTTILQKYDILTGPAVGTPLDENGNTAAPGGEQITQMSLTDFSRWDNVLAAINDPQSTYYSDWQATIALAKRNGLDISTPFDQSDIEALFNRQIDGIDKEIELTKRFKDVVPQSHLDELRGDRTKTVEAKNFMLTLDEANQYADARINFQHVVDDKTSDPFTAMKAATTYYNQLGVIGAKVGDQNPLFSASLNGEMAAMMGQPNMSATIAEGALGSPWTGQGEGTDQQAMSVWMDTQRQLISDASDGNHVLRQDPQTGIWEAPTLAQINSETGGQFVIVPVKTDTVVLEPQAIAHEPGQVFTESVGAANDHDYGLRPTAKTTPMTVSYGQAFEVEPIISRAPGSVDPVTGAEVGTPPTTPQSQNIGMVAYLPDGNGDRTVPVYGIYTNGGELRWTYDPPFRPGTKTDHQFISANAQGLIVTVPDEGKIYFDPSSDTPDQPVPYDPTNPNLVTQFNTQYPIDPLKTRAWDPTTFVDPGLAYMARDDTGKTALAAMSADEVFAAFSASPWVWSNPNAVPEFWQDVANVKAAVQAGNDPNSRLSIEYAFYNEVQASRSPDMGASNMWAKAINQMQTSSLVRSEAAERAAGGFGVGSTTPVVSRPPTPPVDNSLGGILGANGPGGGTPYTLGPTGTTPIGSPYQMGPSSSAANPQIPEWARGAMLAGLNLFPGVTPNAAQPTTKTPTNIKIPNMPGQNQYTIGQKDPVRQNQTYAPRTAPSPAPTPTAPAPYIPAGVLPPAPGPQPNIPGVSKQPRAPHEWDVFGPVTH